MVFQDRREAGRVLGELVAELPDLKDGLVLGLVRGGVPVAYEVARKCGLPLDILIVRKLGVPGQEELAMGAIASGGCVVVNESIIRSYHVSEKKLEYVIERETQELQRRETLYRGGQSRADIEGQTVVLVDDGLATGASMRAAIRAVKGRVRKVIVAVPVGAKSTCEELALVVDHLVCALVPEPLEAVGMFYRDFEATSDGEVKELITVAMQLRTRKS
ncbi:phosphoribosyltransferase [Telmatobacter sp. DSM 110680]|uniref:Phosphoribosyltransferase n=1 Tax=Telmatobacter sp. DSM 110680 TaxID=3036704 RepID=A0AAU7DTC6_9BACT